VLAAGAGGIYWYWNGPEQAAGPQAHSASDQLKSLLTAESPAAGPEVDSQQLFAADRETTAPAAAELQATYNLPPQPTSLLGDRYANMAIATATAAEGEEVTRGQGPDAPLLQETPDSQFAQTAKADQDHEARAAFGDAPPLPVPTAQPAGQAPVHEDAAGFASALQQAEPLAAQVTPPEVAVPKTGVNSFASAPPAAPATRADRYASAAPAMSLPSTSVPSAGFSPGETSAPPSEVSPNVPTPAEPQFASIDPPSTGITPTPGLQSMPGSGRPGERILEGVQSPSLSIQKLAPPEIQVGKRCTFAIRVQNSGQRTAQDVRIHDEIPAGTELVGTSPRATVSGTQVTWELGTLSVGEERTVEMELVPTEEGELGSVATVTLAAQASAKARCTKPELALRLSSLPQVHVGEQQLVQIEISNPGTGVAMGVMLTETVPAGVSHEAGPALEFEVGTLAPGESRRLELVLTAEQAGQISNVMTARSDSGLQVEASCEFAVIAPALQVGVEGPERRFLERPATYQVSVENSGTAPAKEVQLVTHLPKGMQFVSANNLGEYDAATHSVYWSLAELPANERGTVELVTLPIEAGQHSLQIASKARDGLNAEAQKEVLVEGIAALMFEVVDRDDPIEVGGETSYDIRVLNQGSKAAGNVQVVAILPPGLRAISGQGDTRNTIQGDRVVFAPLSQLAPKAESVFRIHAQGVRAGDQRIRVQITTDEIREPITKEESTRVYSDQ
jgi:uncharacterized repeat protein (TIGR01451 family)